jgi:antitoxin MazE
MLVNTKIQKWGNGLALRVSGVLRDIPHFQSGDEVQIEVNEEGFVVKKVKASRQAMPFSEDEIIKGLNPAHAELAVTDLLEAEYD